MNIKENDTKSRKINTYDVYVGHVPKNIQEVTITELFSKYGEVADVLCRFGSGTYGYAIVKFKHQRDANRVLNEVQKVYINGCEMEIKKGKNQKQNVENGEGNNHNSAACFSEVKPKSKKSANGGDCNGQIQDLKYPHSTQKNGTLRQECPVMIEVMCTNVENAVTFYGCPIYRCEELQILSERLNSICPSFPRLLKKPVVRRIYGALFGEDMTWYRGTVIQPTIESKPGMCLIEYIDYGNVDEVSYKNIVDLPEPITMIPPFAVKCILSNLMCNPKSNCDISYLHHLIYERMSLCALSSWGIPEYHVLKCICNGIDVISELVRNGFAVYRAEKFEKTSIPKGQENRKPRKGSATKHNSKKVHAVKDTSSHVEKQHCNADENGNIQNIDNSKISMSSDSQTSISQDFVPKMIIKRPSSINDKASVPLLEEVKVKETVNNFLKVDCVISNLKLVNSVRNLVSLKSEDDVINNALAVLQSDMNVKSSEDAKNEVEKAYDIYMNVINEIKACTDQTLLPDLKEKRNIQMTNVQEKLKFFFENFDSTLFDKQKSIQTMITDLESNSNDWMNVFLSNKPATIEDLLSEYNKEKEKRWYEIQKARENTNEKQKKFTDFLSDFQKEFSLNISEDDLCYSYQLGNDGKKGSWALKFEEALTDLGNVLDEEMKTCKVNKGKSRVSIIQCILDMLDAPKEKIDAECELFAKFKSLYLELSEMANLKSNFDKLEALKKDMVSLKSKCSTKDSSKDVSYEIYHSLHEALLKEDNLMVSLAKASSLHFPELNSEHPELNLSNYQKNWYLLKNEWKKEYFPVLKKCTRVAKSYVTLMEGGSLVVKEFQFEDEAQTLPFIKYAIMWNETKSRTLVKVKALFNQDEKTVCALLPSMWPSLFENPLPVPVERKTACHILQQILLGLRDIHSRGMAHGAVHPISILHKNGKILLDFCYDLKFLHEKACIKGINFQVPNGDGMCKSADMYGYGCLVLWILFPNLSFTKTSEGVPNLFAFQSILKELLSEKDFASLAALLSVNSDTRPSSRDLLSSGFLKDLRVI